MPGRRIGWQGAARTRYLQGQLEIGLTRWQQGWFTEPLLTAEIHSLADDQFDAPLDLQWWKLAHAGASVHFGAVPDIETMLGAAVLEMGPTGESNLIRYVGARCFSELCASLWGRAEESELQRSSRPDPDQFDKRYGSFLCRVDGLPTELWMIASRNWCERFGPARAKSSTHLIRRKAALNSTTVSVSARVELGTILLSESLGLTVGEVLVTEAPQCSLVTLDVGGRRVAAGTLMHGQGTRSVLINQGLRPHNSGKRINDNG